MELARRDVLRLLSLSALAAGGAPLLAACRGHDDAPGPVSSGGLALVSSDVTRVPGDPAAVKGVVASLHTLGGGLLGAVGADQPGNLALSPFSIGVALALTLNGAKGGTLDQMTALFDDADVATINGGLDALTADVEALAGPQQVPGSNDTAEIDLASANQLFGQRGEQWQQDYLDTLARSYGAGLQTVDYGDQQGAQRAINDWAAEQTHDRITDIISSPLDPMTRLVLVNALYLKAPWATKFETSATADGAFTRLDDSVVQVPLMRDAGGYGSLATGDGWTAVSRPYLGDQLAMTIVLPEAGRYAAVEKDVVAGHLPDYLDALQGAEIDLTLPRWTFRTAAELTPALGTLGMTDAFTAQADFSGITTQEPLQLTAVLHQVFIAVDEGGTEAAAVTAVVAGATAAGPPPTPVVVDRPFLFVIHDVQHRTPLFLGRVLDPSQQ